MTSPPLSLNEWKAEIKSWQETLETSVVGRNMAVLPTVGSTNTYAKNHPDLPQGAVVVAWEQTAGRGQRDRKWSSEPGGLYLTAKLVFEDATPHPFWVVSAVAFGVMDGLTTFGLTPTLKWPNDVLVGGKKIAGVLTDVTQQGCCLVMYVGVGVNVRNDLGSIQALFPDLKDKTTSVSDELGSEDVSLTPLLVGICRSLDRYLHHSPPFDHSLMREQWLGKAGLFGKIVVVKDLTTEEVTTGVVTDLTPHGALLVTKETGEQTEVLTGDLVSVRPT